MASKPVSKQVARGRSLRKVLLLVDTSGGYGRGMVRGVALYNREHGRWTITFKPHGLNEPPPSWLRETQADGILARVGNNKMVAAILKMRIPVVDLRGVISGTGLPSVGVDHLKVARLAVDHFLERGFKRFGFCGLPRGVNPYMDELSDLFVGQLADAGYACNVFQAHRGPHRGEAWESQQSRREQWRDQQIGIAQWIQTSPKPLAILACHNNRALQVLDACRRANVLVPEEVAVISAENDEHLCELAVPPLTSVDQNPSRIGYEAAALLERLMNGESPPKQRLLIPPSGVITRVSTDLLAIEDPQVARALRFIRECACEGIRPKDVVDQVPLSRVALGKRFKAAVGHTIGEEIQRVQVRLVQELLSQTELPIKQIARRAGFHYSEYMIRLFQSFTGQTPGVYRKTTCFAGPKSPMVKASRSAHARSKKV
jgi:LacI family transcriptional regulator